MPVLREYLVLNRNVLASVGASLAVSAAVAQLLADQDDLLNTTYTTMADYATYFAAFGGLFYLSNRSRYRLGSGGTDRAALRRDLRRLIASLGVAEVAYTAARWLLQYYFLGGGHDPYLASIMSQAASTTIYMAILNLTARMARLYGDGP